MIGPIGRCKCIRASVLIYAKFSNIFFCVGLSVSLSFQVTWQLTCHFRASLKHKDDGQTKFIKLNSQRQDIIIKY